MVTVKAALPCESPAEEFIRLATVQSERKAKLKSRIPLDRLFFREPKACLPRRCHAGLLKGFADKCHFGLHIVNVSRVSMLQQELIHGIRKRPKELRNTEQLFGKVFVVGGNLLELRLEKVGIGRHFKSSQEIV